MYNKFTIKPKNKDSTIEKQTLQYYLLNSAATDLRQMEKSALQSTIE